MLASLSGCGAFPSIDNGKKQIIKDAAVSSTHLTEVSVKYVCNDGYFYSLDNPIVNCTENGFDKKVGKCIKGKVFFIVKYFLLVASPGNLFLTFS